MYGQSMYRLANLLYSIGRKQEARGYYHQVGEQYRRQARMCPDWRAQTDLARFLASCPFEELRDPAEAVRAASRAIELAPEALVCRCVLGRAQYRIGDLQGAVHTLEHFNRHNDEEPSSFFFLSMSYWKLGNREQARRNFNQGMQRLGREKYPNLIDKQSGAEAAALLGIPEKSTTTAREASSLKE